MKKRDEKENHELNPGQGTGGVGGANNSGTTKKVENNVKSWVIVIAIAVTVVAAILILT